MADVSSRAKEFGATSTTDEVLAGLDLTGKRILVTGVSAGLGIETARALASHGARVVGTARDLKKAEAATADVRQQATAHGGAFDIVELDLANLKSVRTCAQRLIDKGEQFDVIIANAGVMAIPFGRTADGFETQFGTNHLGHFVLVNRIAPLIRTGGRVVILASAGHRIANVDLNDPNFEHTAYDEIIAYGRSKTANVLFAVGFDQRYRKRGVRAAAVHPGAIQTELARHMEPGALEKYTFEYKTVPQGAATSVWAAVVARADEIGGRYCENCHVGQVLGDDVVIEDVAGEGVRKYALDASTADALWRKSEELVGEKYEA
jgi:NAD(P)-dependent dehydrogenase (short-subunit alcohol dehydrogenase family)